MAVYFVQGPQDTDLIKIGYARDGGVRKRLSVLRACSPMPLRLLGSIEGAGTNVEWGLHRQFASDRCHGEWFAPTPELIAFIEGDPTAEEAHAFAFRDVIAGMAADAAGRAAARAAMRTAA